MTRHDPHFSPALEAALQESGASPYADIIPSAAGMPFQTELSPDEFEESTRQLLDRANRRTAIALPTDDGVDVF
jgi:hypothetical protein